MEFNPVLWTSLIVYDTPILGWTLVLCTSLKDCVVCNFEAAWFLWYKLLNLDPNLKMMDSSSFFF